jgi:CheY-like chemotaxis protein
MVANAPAVRADARPILLVDDDASVRRTIARFFTSEGFSVIEAENGHDALSYLRGGGDAAVIVLDLRMPVMDGWTFRREQRLDPRLADIPVIVLSGADAEGVPELNALAAFEKPVSLLEIVNLVKGLPSSGVSQPRGAS